MSRLKTDAIRNTSASADALTFDTNGNTTVVGDATCSGKVHITDDLASGQLLVGTSTSDATTKYGTFNVPHKTNSEEPVMVIGGESTTSDSQSVYIGGGFSTQNAAKHIRFYTAANTTTVTGTQRATIDSDGLKFNADTAAANALSDYEEGTFTPAWVGSTGVGSTTYSQNHASYTKIGELVICRGYTNITASSGHSGDWIINNLPFIGFNSYNSLTAGGCFIENCTWRTDTVWIVPYKTENDSTMKLYGSERDATWKALSTMDDSTFGIIWGLTYRTT